MVGIKGGSVGIRELDAISDGSRTCEADSVNSKVLVSSIELCSCLSRYCETNLYCKSSVNNGSGTNLDNSVSEKFTNKDVSNRASKGISSTYMILTGQDADRVSTLELSKLNWLSLSELSWLPCFLRVLGIRFGFSNIVGGSGSGFALVFLLEASVLIFSENKNYKEHNQLLSAFRLLDSIIQKV